MKKFKMGIMALFSFVFSSIAFSQAPTASGNVMKFSGVSSYEPFTEDRDTWVSLKSIAAQSSTLTTLAELTTAPESDADTLYPDFLKEVLNTDYIFQIGNYLIKIDLTNDRGLVIDSRNHNAYSSLVNNNLSATGMMALGGDEEFGVDLLAALENNSTTPADYQTFLDAQRSCRGAARYTMKKTEEWHTTNEQCDIGGSYTIGRTYGKDNKVVYQKFIFYFSLQSKIRSVWRCTFGGSWTFASIYPIVDLRLIATVKYRKRCGDEVNKSADLTSGYYGGGDGILHWRPYESSRSLSHYDFNVDFGIRPAQDRSINPPPYHMGLHYRIVAGY